jgi:hypothetical protein
MSIYDYCGTSNEGFERNENISTRHCMCQCKASYAVAHENAHIGAALMCSLQLDRHRHEPLPSLRVPASIDAISHPTQPHFHSQRWTLYDTVLGPHARARSSCVPLRTISFHPSPFPLPVLFLSSVLCSSLSGLLVRLHLVSMSSVVCFSTLQWLDLYISWSILVCE